jgi:hypothetical protein
MQWTLLLLFALTACSKGLVLDQLDVSGCRLDCDICVGIELSCVEGTASKVEKTKALNWIEEQQKPRNLKEYREGK